MDLFRLRCYMAQRPGDDEQALLRPHAAFVVDKAKSSRGKKSPRLLLFNLLEQAGTGPPATPARHPGHARAAALRMRSPFRAQRMFNYKKDTLQNEFDLSDIDHIEEASEGGTSRGDQKLEVTIHFKQTHPYYQGHMLGQGDSENLAGRLFKKCAYVADSVYRNKQIGL